MAAIPLSEPVGVQITDLDLRHGLDDAHASELRGHLAAAHLLVFRDQHISEHDQISVLSRFGDVVDEAGDGARCSFVSNVRDDGVLTEGKQLLFHADNMFTAAPLATISLFGVQVDGPTAPTRFANTERAFTRIPADAQAGLREARVLNLSGFAGGWYRYRDAEVEAQHPRAVHPVVARNPRSGNLALRVSEQQSDRILDWDPEHSEGTLQQLFGALYDPSNVYEHEWRTGDLLIWDNLALQHGRPALPGRGERTLRRVAVVDGDAGQQAAWGSVTRAAEAAARTALS